MQKHTLKRRAVPKLKRGNQASIDKSAHVISAMLRDPDLTLNRAAKLHHVKPSTVKKHAGQSLTKVKGVFRVKRADQLPVTLYVPGPYGNAVPIHTHSLKERREASEYLRDLGRYLRGQVDALARWHGKKIAGVELVTDGRTIRAIEPALSDFSLYRTFSGGDR
jgi:hypothetical protein